MHIHYPHYKGKGKDMQGKDWQNSNGAAEGIPHGDFCGSRKKRKDEFVVSVKQTILLCENSQRFLGLFIQI